MLNLRQARTLRAALQLGSFTATEVASRANETRAYVLGLLNSWKGRWIEEVQPKRLGRVGPPEKICSVRPECQQEILELLNSISQLDEPRGATINYTYRFVRRESEPGGFYKGQITCRADGTMLLSLPTTKKNESTESAAKVVLFDTPKAASGLTTLFRCTYRHHKGVAAIVDVGHSAVLIAIVKKGECEFTTVRRISQLKCSSELTTRSTVAIIASAIKFFEDQKREKVEQIFLTGDLQRTPMLQAEVQRQFKRPCLPLDPSKAIEIEVQGPTVDFSGKCMRAAAEIGYVLRQSEKIVLEPELFQSQAVKLSN